jgi:chromosome partitioning protein
MKNIAVIARKGGSGKSTVAIHLALAAHLRGLRTVLADTDPQQSSVEVLKARLAEGPKVHGVAGSDLLALRDQSAAAGADLMVIDTPAAAEGEIAHAIAAAHLSILVIRPTFLDIAASIQTAQILRSLRRPGIILLSQAPVTRGGVEPPAVVRAKEALQLMRLPVVPLIVRSRVGYQTALASGRSIEEIEPNGAAAREVNELWNFVERFALGQPKAHTVAKSA